MKKVSICLSYLLRHRKDEDELFIDDEGFADVNSILNHPKMKNASLKIIREIVEKDEKQRYFLKEEDGKILIRANQGHSFDVPNLHLQKLEKIDEAIHSTYLDKIEAIKSNGLSRMGRRFIHFADGNYKSYFRKDYEVLIHIDVKSAIERGIEFFKSSNGVILSDGIDHSEVIPSEFFSRIEIRE